MATCLLGPSSRRPWTRGRVRPGKEESEKCQAFQRSRRAGECFDSKEVVCDLGKLWPFGMEGAEVALDTDQERAELEEMGEWET